MPPALMDVVDRCEDWLLLKKIIEESHAAIDSYLKTRLGEDSSIHKTRIRGVKCFRCNGSHCRSECNIGLNIKCFHCGGAHRPAGCLVDQESRKGLKKRNSYLFCLEKENMILTILVNGLEVSALVDTGADRSFIQEKFAELLNLQVMAGNLRIRTASETMVSSGRVSVRFRGGTIGLDG